jgi:hypothetical protein
MNKSRQILPAHALDRRWGAWGPPEFLARPFAPSAIHAHLSVDKTLIGSVEGELRSHEIWESQVDALLKLDRATKNQTSNDSHEVVPKGFFLSGPQAGISWLLAWLIDRPAFTPMRPLPSRTYDAVRPGAASK